jgi:N-hydroxyarylamine O-acetyltransferase
MDSRTVDAYLRRIGASRTSSLAELHERHLLSIPFENLSIHLGERIVLDEVQLVDKIVNR